MRLVSPHEYTRLNDLRLAKKWMLEEQSQHLAILEDYHLGFCCQGIEKQVRKVYLGRIRGVDFCDDCIKIELQFIQKLLDFDDAVEFKFDSEVLDIVNEQNKAFEKLKKEALSMEQKKRQKLEKAGQQRLF